MDSEVLDIAKISLEVNSNPTIEIYRERREELNKGLGNIATMRSPKEAVANAEMLKNIGYAIPCREEGSFMSVESPADMRAFQSTVFTVKKGPASYPRFTVLLGAKQNKRSVSFLGLKLSQGLLQETTVRAKSFKRLSTVMQSKMTTPFDEKELSEITHVDSYRIHASSPSMPSIRSFGKTEEINAISDQTLAEYNVFNYVGNIALAFDKTAEIGYFLANNAKKRS